MKIYVCSDNTNSSYYWELRLNKSTAIYRSDSLGSQPDVLESLESVLLSIETSPIVIPPDENAGAAFMSFTVIKLHDDKWRCEVSISSENKKILTSDDIDGFLIKTKEAAIERAKSIRHKIAFAKICDSAGVLIPNMHFSADFANSRSIRDIHPSYAFLKNHR